MIMILVFGIISVGIALIYLLRISRIKNEELKREGRDDLIKVISNQDSSAKDILEANLFSTQPKVITFIGCVLAIAVTVVIGLFVIVVVAIILADVIIRSA